jgi:hypothetical protein
MKRCPLIDIFDHVVYSACFFVCFFGPVAHVLTSIAFPAPQSEHLALLFGMSINFAHLDNL